RRMVVAPTIDGVDRRCRAGVVGRPRASVAALHVRTSRFPVTMSRFFLRVVEKDDEVARVHLENEVEVDHYADVPSLGASALAIQFIEVHNNHRLRGIGHGVIDLLQNRYPDRRLVAFSEGADGFWSSLGWR